MAMAHKSYERDPCPIRVFNDVTGAMLIGLVIGTAWNGFKGTQVHKTAGAKMLTQANGLHSFSLNTSWYEKCGDDTCAPFKGPSLDGSVYGLGWLFQSR
jgi:hypothetical protein